MSKKIKRVSIIFIIFIVFLNAFRINALTAEKVDEIETKFCGEFTNLISNKTVVSFSLHTTNDILTKKEIEQIYMNNIISDWNISNVNRVSTGDTFKVDGNEYIVIIYGDVNKDGYINTIDNLLINKYTAGTRTLEEDQKIAADVGNIDGYINSIDASVIFNFTVGNRDTVLDSIPYNKEYPLYPQLSEIQAIYGQKIKDIKTQLPVSDIGTFRFDVSEVTEVGDAGTHTVTVTFTPNDTQKYKIVTDIPVTINVSQAEPNYQKINGLVVEEEQILADAVSLLPISDLGEYSFLQPLETSVGSVGTHQVEIKYTPFDSNYKTVTFFTTMTVQEINMVAKVTATKIENEKINYCEDENVVGQITASNRKREDLTEKIKTGKIEAELNCEVIGVYDDKEINDSNSGVIAKVELNEAGQYEIKLTAQYPGEYTIVPTAKGDAVKDTLEKEPIKVRVEDKTIATAIKLIDKASGKELQEDTIELYSNRNNRILVEFYHVYNSGRAVKVEKTGKEVALEKSGEIIQQYTGLCDETESPITENKEVKSLYVEAKEVIEEALGTLSLSVDGVQKVITVKAQPVATDRIKVNNDIYEIDLPENGDTVDIPVEALDILGGKKTITSEMIKTVPTSENRTIAIYLANEAYSNKTPLYLTVTPNSLTGIEIIKLNINTSRVNDDNIYDIFKSGIVFEFDSNEGRDKSILIPKNIIENNTVAKVTASKIENNETNYCEDENVVGHITASNLKGQDLTEKVKSGKIEAVLDCEVTGIYDDKEINDSNSGVIAKVELNEAGQYEIKLTAQYPGEYTIMPIAKGNDVKDMLIKEPIQVRVEDKTTVDVIKLIDKETEKEIDALELNSNRNNNYETLVEFYHVYNSGREVKVEKTGKEVKLEKTGEILDQYAGLCDETESPITENKEVKSLYVEVKEVTEERVEILTLSVDGAQKVITVKAQPVATDRIKVNNDVYEIELPENGDTVDIPVEALDVLEGKKTITSEMIKIAPTAENRTIAVYLANEAYTSKTPLYLTVTPNSLTNVETIKLNINRSKVNEENIYDIFKAGIVFEFDSNEGRDKVVLIPKNIIENNTVAKVTASKIENNETNYCEDENVVGQITVSNLKGKDLTEKVKSGKIEAVLDCEVTGVYDNKEINDGNSGVTAKVELNETIGQYEIKLTAQYPGEYTIVPTAKGNSVKDTLTKESIQVRVEDKKTATAIKLIDKASGKELQEDTIELYSNRNNENGILIEFYHVYNSGREVKVEKTGKEVALKSDESIFHEHTNLCDIAESPITENKEVKSLYVEVKEVTEETIGTLIVTADETQKVIAVKAKPVATDRIKVNNDVYEIELPENGDTVDIPVEALDVLGGKKTITSEMIKIAPTAENGTIAIYLANEAYTSKTPLYLTVTPNSLTSVETIKLNINRSKVNEENIYDIFKSGVVFEFDSNEGRDKVVLIPKNIRENSTVAKLTANKIENEKINYCEDENVVGHITVSNLKGQDLTEKVKSGKIEAVLDCEVTGVYDNKEINDGNSGVTAKVELNEAGQYEIKLTAQYPGEYTIVPTAKGNSVKDTLTKEPIQVRVEDKKIATAIKLIDKASGKELQEDIIELYSNRNNENGILIEFYHVYNSGREVKVAKTGKEVKLEKTGEILDQYVGLCDETESPITENKEVKSLYVEVKEVAEEATGTVKLSVDEVQKEITVIAQPVATDRIKVNNGIYEIELPENGDTVDIPVEAIDTLGEKKTILSTMIRKTPTSEKGTVAIYLANEAYASKTPLYLTVTPNSLTSVETIKLNINTSKVNEENIYDIFKAGIVFEFDSNEGRDKIVLIPKNLQVVSEEDTIAKLTVTKTINDEVYYCEDENVVGEITASNVNEEDLTEKIKSGEIDAVLDCKVTGTYDDKKINDSNSEVLVKVELNETTGKYEIKLTVQYPGEYRITPTAKGDAVSKKVSRPSMEVVVKNKTTNGEEL